MSSSSLPSVGVPLGAHRDPNLSRLSLAELLTCRALRLSLSCSPWGDYNVKIVSWLLTAARCLVDDGYMDEENVHHQYGLRVASQMALSAGASEFRARYNGHNVKGPRGGIPDVRRKYRTRPAGTGPPQFIDCARDWAAEYAAASGKAYHAETHIVQWYSEQLAEQLDSLQPPPPTAAAAWRDVKMNSGRGEFRLLFAVVVYLSTEEATAASIKAAQQYERRQRGAKALHEDH